MSNLGIQVIYSLINNYPDAICERVFYEPSDNIPLAMESQRPLSDFAVLAFSLNFELDYFNISQILKLSGIPVYAKDRDETHPIVIAGGPCVTVNPMPISPFFDCLCIGEAEAILPALLPVFKERSSEDRQALLNELAKLPGVYVPGITERPVRRQWLADLDTSPVHSTVLTRETELGEMYLIEVQRGCKWGCRFCLVNCAYKPMRVHSCNSLISQAKEGLKRRKRLGLVGPAVTDHPQIEELVSQLHGMGAEISVSSLRIRPLPSTVLGEVAKGTTTVALAPEAGSQRLRNYIHKGINEDHIFRAVEKVGDQGVKQLKLYFMIGLPSENDDDIIEMAELVLRCKAILDTHVRTSRITLTIAPFIPKAGTHFQREGMESIAVIKYRLALLKSRLPEKGISVKNESIDWSEVQAILSRGDENLAIPLANMVRTSLAEWRRVTTNTQFDTNFHAHAKWDAKQELPWGMIEI
jgi:radical SAM superfamily enzyme YgiQ (UPF0313 family)